MRPEHVLHVFLATKLNEMLGLKLNDHNERFMNSATLICVSEEIRQTAVALLIIKA